MCDVGGEWSVYGVECMQCTSCVCNASSVVCMHDVYAMQGEYMCFVCVRRMWGVSASHVQ